MKKFALTLLLLPVAALSQPVNGHCVDWIVSGSVTKQGDAGFTCGSGGSGGGVVTYSGPALSVLTGTSFCPIGGGGSCSTTETNVDIDSSAAATVSNMYVQLSAALGLGNSVVITWRDNAANKSVTCTISGASATSCNDTIHSFNVANGDLLDYQLVFSGTIVVTPTVTIMSAFGTSNIGITSVFGNTGPTVGATGDINVTGRVIGINSVPLCTGFTPTNGQNLQYTTASSPNPCYTAATGSASGGLTKLGQALMTSSTACSSTGSLTVTCAAGSITFSSIPGTYSNLQVVISGRSLDAATEDGVVMQANGDTAAHYAHNYLVSNGSAGLINNGSVPTAVSQIGTLTANSNTANYPGTINAIIGSYAGTTFFKAATGTTAALNSSTVSGIELHTWIWQSTSAITSLAFTTIAASNFATGTTVTIYGIQ